MRDAKVLILLLLLLGAGLLATAGPAPASCREAVTPEHAHRHVLAAERQLRRAKAELREARAIEGATCAYSGKYGTDVGRWVWLSHETRWPRSQWGMLFYVIHRESGGSPGIVNQSSGAAGLLQFMPPWYHGQWGYHSFDPFDPRENLKAGLWLWQRESWNPWSM